MEKTPQPEKTGKEKGGNKTSLVLSAVAIAIALAAGVGLYSVHKQQLSRQNAASSALAAQIAALQKSQEGQKPNSKASSGSRLTS